MGKARAFSFFVLGVVSLVAQVLLLREALMVFTGNEFFIGWTLCIWLFWTAAGAAATRHGLDQPAVRKNRVAACHLAAAALLPAEVVVLRTARAWLGGGAGAVPDLLPSLGFLLAALAPLCLVLGAQFVFGLRALAAAAAAGAESSPAGGRAYALETAGFAAGGIGFSFAFATLDPFRIAGLLGFLNLAAALALRPGRGRWRAAGVAAGAAVLLAAGGRIDRMTEAWRYPGQELVDSRRSIYGVSAVTVWGGQRNFFENGLLLGAEDEQLASEQLVHYPMLWHPQPRQVLVLGGGFNGALGEILKHAPAGVDYVELDPALIALVRDHADPDRHAALDDPRVRTVFADGRRFLAASAAGPPEKRYDVVLVNLPGPGTLLLNRYYTAEFFEAARRRLAPGGVLAVRLAFSPDYLGRELADLGSSLDRTLRSVFAVVSILPDYDLLFLASDTPPPDAATLQARFAARGLQTGFVSPPAIGERLATDRIGQVRAAFGANRTAQVNRDARPIACVYTLAYWLRSFQPRAAAAVSRAAAAGWPWGGAAVAAVLLAMALAVRGRPARLGPWAMGVGGFSLMSCELVLLLHFQAFCGYLYHEIALILAVLMLGMAAGTALGARQAAGAGPRRLALIHAAAAAGAAGLLVFLRQLEQAAGGGSAGIAAGFMLGAAVLGSVAGFEFPVAGSICRTADRAPAHRDGGIYAADLAGACIGALLVGLWALPVLGAAATLGLLAALHAGTAVVAVISRFRE